MGSILNPFIDRKSLLKKLSMWRLSAIILFVFLAFKLFLAKDLSVFQTDYVAQIWIEGFISDDRDLKNSIESIYRDKRAKALIVNINSPGGTFVGGEKFYTLLRKFSKSKPTVAVLGDQATSAAYLIALGTDHIIAHNGTLTGSVGVILQSLEVTELAKKIGIKPIIFKSSPLKGTPHPAEKLTSGGKEYLKHIIDSSQEIFLNIVKERRKNIKQEHLLDIEQGKIYTGHMAKNNNLIDEVGGYDNAINWLKGKNVMTDIVLDIDIYNNKSGINNLIKGLNFINNFNYKLLSVF